MKTHVSKDGKSMENKIYFFTSTIMFLQLRLIEIYVEVII